MTHNSLVASQRPHISLIDRRHFDDVALPIRMLMCLTKSAYVKRKAVARPLTSLSHISVWVARRGCRDSPWVRQSIPLACRIDGDGPRVHPSILRSFSEPAQPA